MNEMSGGDWDDWDDYNDYITGMIGMTRDYWDDYR